MAAITTLEDVIIHVVPMAEYTARVFANEDVIHQRLEQTAGCIRHGNAGDAFVGVEPERVGHQQVLASRVVGVADRARHLDLKGLGPNASDFHG